MFLLVDSLDFFLQFEARFAMMRAVMRIRLWFTAALAGLFGVTAHIVAAPVTLTSVDGTRSVEVEILSVNPSSGVLTGRLGDGKSVNLAFRGLDEASQKIVRDWYALTAAVRTLNVTVREMDAGPVKETRDGRLIETTNAAYQIALRNGHASELEGLTVDYQVFYRTGIGSESPDARGLKMAEGSQAVEEIKPQMVASVSTTPVSICSDRPDPRAKKPGG